MPIKVSCSLSSFNSNKYQPSPGNAYLYIIFPNMFSQKADRDFKKKCKGANTQELAHRQGHSLCNHKVIRMKIQCDVCGREEASVFCTADVAALCHTCDNRVHNANKFASKHPRFSLLNPHFKESPICDICQVKRALLFCQEDRALLCRECDIPIHGANVHTEKHNRFLLTGVKLSAAYPSYQAATSSCGSQIETGKHVSGENETNFHQSSIVNCSESSSNPWRDNESNQHVSRYGSDSTSSISEYLMETGPGWQVENLLDPSSSNGFY